MTLYWPLNRFEGEGYNGKIQKEESNLQFLFGDGIGDNSFGNLEKD